MKLFAVCDSQRARSSVSKADRLRQNWIFWIFSQDLFHHISLDREFIFTGCSLTRTACALYLDLEDKSEWLRNSYEFLNRSWRRQTSKSSHYLIKHLLLPHRLSCLVVCLAPKQHRTCARLYDADFQWKRRMLFSGEFPVRQLHRTMTRGNSQKTPSINNRLRRVKSAFTGKQ